MIRSPIELRATTVAPPSTFTPSHAAEALQRMVTRWAGSCGTSYSFRIPNRRRGVGRARNSLILKGCARVARIGAVRRECSTGTPPPNQTWNIHPLPTTALPKNGMGCRGGFAQAGAP